VYEGDEGSISFARSLTFIHLRERMKDLFAWIDDHLQHRLDLFVAPLHIAHESKRNNRERREHFSHQGSDELRGERLQLSIAFLTSTRHRAHFSDVAALRRLRVKQATCSQPAPPQQGGLNNERTEPMQNAVSMRVSFSSMPC